MKVIINSLPKSGTHLVANLFNLLNFTKVPHGLTGALVRLTGRNPINLVKKAARREKNCEIGLPIDLDIEKNCIKKEWLHKYLNRIGDGSFITAHLPYNEELSDFLASHSFKIIYIYRDPRDVFLSLLNYHTNKSFKPFYKEFQNADLDERINMLINGIRKKNYTLSSFTNRLNRSIGWLKDKNILKIKFEDLIGPKGKGEIENQKKTLTEILKFIELNINQEKIEYLLNHIYSKDSKTFNKGKIGEWKTAFSEEQKNNIVNNYKELIIKYGYKV